MKTSSASDLPQRGSTSRGIGWLGRHKVLATVGAILAAVLIFASIGAADDTAPEAPTGGSLTTVTPSPYVQPTTNHARNRNEHARRQRTRPARAEPRRQSGLVYLVASVVDGDTVKILYRGARTVRLIGIDTPETVSPSVPDECFGAQASAAATHLLSGKQVGIEFDRSQGRKDRYGRMLAYLALPNGKDFGATMIRKGFAIEYTYDSAYKHQAEYLAAEHKAKATDRGLWRKCGGADVPLKAPGPDKTAPEPATGGGSCASGYSPCIPSYPPDLDCDDVNGPITVTGSDPHGLDSDGNGIACET